MPHCNKKMLSFFLTTRCNLCCRYCYNQKERNAVEEQSIPIEIAQAAIDWYFANNESRHIRFYGPGEPTQEFSKMKAITEYARNHKNRGADVTVEIQTNGVFLPEVRDWVHKNANIVWMSFDGMKDIQDYNRPLNPMFEKLFGGRTSATVLEENVKWLIENSSAHTNLMVGARVTITDKNVKKQREMVDYFYGLGIRHVWTDTVFYSVGKTPVCLEKPPQKKPHAFSMKEYVMEYLDAYRYAEAKKMFWGSFYIINFDGLSPYHCRSCTPLEAPHITTDGYISACDMALKGEEDNHMQQFIVGKWDSDRHEFIFYYDKIKTLNNRKSTQIKHCSNCPAQLHCGGQCLGEIVNEFGTLDGQNYDKCYAVIELYKKLGDQKPFPFLHP